MWAETWWMPALFLTDGRVRWEAVDAETALLVVPFENSEERFVVRFDPTSGLPRYTEAMRYQGQESPSKSLWITNSLKETWANGVLVGSVGSATWFQDGRPWAVFTNENHPVQRGCERLWARQGEITLPHCASLRLVMPCPSQYN
jgi:hypothetical protein